tara:strand:- start:1101 stop:2843 length:1743 start_codon:yes stop_codon:yes gene_type:complete
MKLFKHPIVLETACGHDGNVKVLKKLVDIAAASGAKVIKFQIFNLKERAKDKTKESRIFKQLIISEKDWKFIINYSKRKNLLILADVYGNYSFDLAKKLKVDGYKIHSEDFFNTYFIEKVINDKKPVIINIGGTYKSEVYNLLSYLKKKKKLSKKIILMMGVQTFPTPLEGHSLDEFKNFVKNYSKFKISFGYADHFNPDDELSKVIPLAAYALGANIIEKHYTDNRKQKRTDYQSAMDSEKIKKFIDLFNNFKKTFIPSQKLNNFEKKYRKMFKKSISFTKEKKIGTLIKQEDLYFSKNKKNFSPIFSHDVVGKKITKDVSKNESINLKKLNNKIGAIIVARMSSRRYPQKAIKKINGEYSLSLVIRRIKKIKSLDEIILATSKDKSDNFLKEIAKKEDVKFFRGSLNKVANRYYQSAKKFKLDHFVRVTGDAILCDEIMLEKAIKSHISKKADVTFIKNMPYGTAKEIISFNTIKTINDTAKEIHNTEYLEWFLENERNFKINYVKSNYHFNKTTRLTLDYKEDLKLFDLIFKHFNNKCDFTLGDVLKFLKKKPHYIKINNFLIPKFKKEDINTELEI